MTRPPLFPTVALAAILLIGTPLFVRTPVWVDVTYHDLSAWNVLNGGVHYRDVFETNLPGMVGLHCLVRSVVGWSFEAFRLVDLAVIGSAMLLLTRPMKSAGLSVAGRVWFLAAAALFYLFETEFIHCQRDGWMLLPAALATVSRVKRLVKSSGLPAIPASRTVVAGVLEGLAWGCAVWIKPHALVPALAVWAFSLRFVPRGTRRVDFLGLLTGGLMAGGAGCAWLILSGTWPHLWDVLLNWNGEYYSWSAADVVKKVRYVPGYFAPFSLLHFVAVPIGSMAICRRGPARAPAALLAALYLGWLAQATFFQKPFDYSNAPPTLLGLAVLAIHRWPVGPVFLAWCVATGLLGELAPDNEAIRTFKEAFPTTGRIALPRHPIAQSERLRLWGCCWYDDSPELKDRLTFYHDAHCAPDWADLGRVADYLKTLDLHDRDLICWHDSTHPLYVTLGIKPGLRYPHVITAMKFHSKLDEIRRETFASPAKYVVSDLIPVGYSVAFGPPPPPGPTDRLPPEFPAWGADTYPWNQPVVFRAGRYFVHQITNPRGKIDFPWPAELKD